MVLIYDINFTSNIEI